MYKILAECPLFRGLNEAQIEEIFTQTQNYNISHYKKGDVIARKDEPCSWSMIILEGEVEGVMMDDSSKRVRVDTIDAPNLIAPAFIFGGCNRLPVDVVALGDVTLLTLHRGSLFELMQSDILIMSNFVDIISDRANVWAKKIYFLSFRSLKEKFAKYLLQNVSAEGLCCLPDTGTIAQIFGSTRNALVRVINDMERRKIVELDQNCIKIINLTALENILK